MLVYALPFLYNAFTNKKKELLPLAREKEKTFF